MPEAKIDYSNDFFFLNILIAGGGYENIYKLVWKVQLRNW